MQALIAKTLGLDAPPRGPVVLGPPSPALCDMLAKLGEPGAANYGTDDDGGAEEDMCAAVWGAMMPVPDAL